MRPASIVCMAAMTLILVSAVTATGEAPASPWNDTPASSTPSAAPATVAPAPANPSATPVPAAPAPPAVEPATAPGAVAPPATTVAGPDPKVVAELQATNGKLYNRYSKDATAAVKSKTEEIVRNYQPQWVAADAKIEKLTKALPTADRQGWDAGTKQHLRDQAAGDLEQAKVEKMLLQKACEDEIGRAAAEGRARLLQLRKVFENHRIALAKGQMLTEDEMVADYDAAMKMPPPAGPGSTQQVQDDTVIITLMNPIGKAVAFDIGEGADKVAGQIQPRGRVIFRFKKIQTTLHAMVVGDNRNRPVNLPMVIERNTLLQFWIDEQNKLGVYDRTSEAPAAAAGSMAPGGAPVTPMEARRGVPAPPPSPPKK